MTLRFNSWHFRRFEAWNRFNDPHDKKELREQIANGRRLGLCEYFRGVIFGAVGAVLGAVVVEPSIRLVELVIAAQDRSAKPVTTIRGEPISATLVLAMIAFAVALAVPFTRDFALVIAMMMASIVGALIAVIALIVVREVAYPAIKDGIAATDAYKLAAARYHAFRAKTCPVISFTE